MTQFFYDNQVRRYLLQAMRIFNNFHVEFGSGDNVILRRVPVRYGDSMRMTSTIIRENSENKVLPVPMISCYITGLEYDPERRQNPTFVEKMHIRTQKFDEELGEYVAQQGRAATIERHMPVPYSMVLNIDIWTSNTLQKLQLWEQIVVFFNPDFEIQSTDNYIDWGSLTYMRLDSTSWSNRAIPIGAEDQIDISTMQFTIPIFIEPPAKITKLGVVQKIVASIYDETGEINDDIIDKGLLLGDRLKITSLKYGILIVNDMIRLLETGRTSTNEANPKIIDDPPEKVGDDAVSWQSIITTQGELQPGISRILLDTGNGEISGTIAYHPSDPYLLLFSADEDTLPQDDLGPITRIIDPQSMSPGNGLDAPEIGQRYLLTDMTNNAPAWSSIATEIDLIADANDIIEFQNNSWRVVFDASESSDVHFLTNTHTGIRYRWTGDRWEKVFEGEYRAGEWQIII